MIDNDNTELVERLAKVIAPHMEGYRSFELMPRDRTAHRKLFRKGECDVNDATQDDALEVARAILPIIAEREAAARAAGAADMQSRVAWMIQCRMDLRFSERGTREPDTNACYYEGTGAEIFEALDEEADEVLSSIAALGQPVAPYAPSYLEALKGVMDILGKAESNASGNPEWDYVGPRVAAYRDAIAALET